MKIKRRWKDLEKTLQSFVEQIAAPPEMSHTSLASGVENSQQEGGGVESL